MKSTTMSTNENQEITHKHTHAHAHTQTHTHSIPYILREKSLNKNKTRKKYNLYECTID